MLHVDISFLSTQVCIVAVRGYALLFAPREMFICLKLSPLNIETALNNCV